MSIFPKNPGNWLQYTKKKENKGLHILEVKSKYLKELLLWENFLSSVNAEYQIQHQSNIGHGGNNPIFNFPPFILQWTTTGTDEVVTLGLSDNGTSGTFTYDFRINWGDGSADEFYSSSANITHTYATAGTYSSSIYGTFPAMNMDNITPENLSGVINWGSSPFESLYEGFRDQSNLTTFNPPDVPTFSYPADLSYLVAFATVPSNFKVYNWNLNNVTTVYGAFAFTDFTNLPNFYLAGWNTRNVTDFSFLFYNNGISALERIRGLYTWDVGNVTNMTFAFSGIGNVESLNLNGWNTSKTTNMSSLFRGNTGAGQRSKTSDLDLRGWDFSNVTNMGVMLFTLNSSTSSAATIDADKLNINNWDVSNVTDMTFMFAGFNGNLGDGIDNTGSKPSEGFRCNLKNWDVGNVKDMENMFDSAFISSIGDVGDWNVSKVTNFADMFQFCHVLEDIDVASWDTSEAENMADMFLSCSFSKLDIDNWNTAKVQNMSGTFQNMKNITTLDFRLWDYSSVTNMTNFLTGTSITTTDYSNLLSTISSSFTVNNVTLGAGTNTFNSEASASRSALVAAGWTITDGGQV